MSFKFVIPVAFVLMALSASAPAFSGHLGRITTAAASGPQINIPYFGSSAVDYDQAALIWYGSVQPDVTHTDVRLGYNKTQLFANFNIVDRRLWWDQSRCNQPSAPDNFAQWDSVALILNVGSDQYRFAAMLNNWPGCAAQTRAAFKNGEHMRRPFTTKTT